MKLVEEIRVKGQILHEEGLHLVITARLSIYTMICQKPECVGIDHEDRLSYRVEEDAVCRLRSDAPDGEKLVP